MNWITVLGLAPHRLLPREERILQRFCGFFDGIGTPGSLSSHLDLKISHLRSLRLEASLEFRCLANILDHCTRGSLEFLPWQISPWLPWLPCMFVLSVLLCFGFLLVFEVCEMRYQASWPRSALLAQSIWKLIVLESHGVCTPSAILQAMDLLDLNSLCKL